MRKRGQEVMCGKVRKGVNKIDQLDLFKHFPQLLERARAFCTSLGRLKCFTDEWQTADFSPFFDLCVLVSSILLKEAAWGPVTEYVYITHIPSPWKTNLNIKKHVDGKTLEIRLKRVVLVILRVYSESSDSRRFDCVSPPHHGSSLPAVATCLLYTDGKNAPCAFSLMFPPASSSLLSIPVALCKVCWGHRQMDGTH